ncbi:MAG: PAS domain-containing protein, partial [Acidobacteria bacterium]|nr:PAS domain-containing protein [Acidobacteriota bacterium]
PEPLLQKYFDSVNGNFVVNRDLRRAVIFGRHDLLQDAPISKVDLLLCRNTLMYFNSEAQARIVQRLYFSLNPSGSAILGRAEMLFTHATAFTPVDLKRRVFRTVPKATTRDRLLLMSQGTRDGGQAHVPEARLRELAFEHDSIAQLLLDADGTLSAVNGQARDKFHITARDVGRPFQDLEVSYRPAEIRGALDRAVQQRSEVRLSDIPWTVSGALRHFDTAVCPVFEDGGTLLGIRVSFHDITEMRALQIELQHSKQELETAYEELQSTNEELETTNEELQSTVEELETTNEELQSANEELETMNEELQSTNEELQAMNDELRARGTEVNRANAFLESIFASMASAVVVLDRDLCIKVWNDRATDLWGVRADETHAMHFLGLDIGLPVVELRQPIRDVLSGNHERATAILPATSRRGRPIECRVSVSPLHGADRVPAGVILFMEEISAEKLA